MTVPVKIENMVSAITLDIKIDLRKFVTLASILCITFE